METKTEMAEPLLPFFPAPDQNVRTSMPRRMPHAQVNFPIQRGRQGSCVFWRRRIGMAFQSRPSAIKIQHGRLWKAILQQQNPTTMSRKKKRKRNRAAKRRSTTAVQEQPEAAANAVEGLLDIADNEPNPQVAVEIYQTALDQTQYAGAVSTDDIGDRLWDDPDGRCHLRALFGIAAALWRLKRIQESARHFEELLRADPADNFFARYWLAACLLDAGRLEELGPLLDHYDEPTAFWRYAQALWAFATHGDGDESCQLLKEANRLDAKFLEYLLGDGLVRADQPIRFERGRNATHSTARLLLPAWRSVPGAATWVRRVLRVPLGQPDTALPFPHEQLLDLPQQDASWQVGLRQLDAEQAGDEPCWVLGVADVRREQMRCLTVIEGDPTPDAVWREILTAFLRPIEGTPQRPRRLEVPRTEFRRAWRPLLNELDIECRLTYQPQPVSQLLEGMADVVAAQRLPRLDDDFDVRELPPSDATWQIDFFHQPMMISNEDVGVQRPWSVLVMDKASGHVLCTKMIAGEPAAERLWEYAARVMLQVAGRPRRIEVSDSDGYDFLQPRLAAAEVQCVLLDELPELHSFCLRMASSFGGPEKCALADGQDVDRDSMESFYYAAARYFRRAPWQHVPGEIPIETKVAGFAARYAIVLGRTGVTLGLAVHESWQDAADMISGWASWENLAGFAVIFDEEAVLAPADLYLVERHGWPIASPEAYPAVMRFRPGCQPGSPTADELEFLAACLHCVPDFVSGNAETQTYPQSDNGPKSETQLSWTSPQPRRQVSRKLAADLDETGQREREPRSATVADAATVVQHVNRKGDTYYLHQGRTKTGKPKYFFSKKSEGELCGQLPDGFEIYENPRGQIYCRRIQPKLITQQEIEVVREALQKCGLQSVAAVDVKGKDIIVYEREHPCLKFTLCDDDKRLFAASRWCYLGSIDDWFPLFGGPQPLSELANNCCPHVGEESLFELM